MKAAYIHATGPADQIQFGDLPDPIPQGAEVLVRVGAASVNPIDTYIRSGAIAMDLPLPYVVGCDLAGTVEAVGPDASDFKVGDRVWGSNQGLLGRQGTCSQYAKVDQQWLYRTPDGVRNEDAAAISLVGITAHLGLVRDAKLKKGEILFVNGGTGGVGSAVVQMAKILGAKVITTAGSEEKVQACLELGADLAINYKTEDVSSRIKEFAPDGVHVWWETLREPNFDRTIAHLRQRGRMILMAGRDARPEFPVGPFYVRECRLFGFVMFLASAEEQQAAADDINRWLAEGKLKPRIDRALPLAETATAHRLQEESTVGLSGALSGKIVIVP
ncbi:MAG: NADPH:quinone reductase [Planctomycetales bacterium]|nr:NADPH:quinone reductase [Planctomycetales bacterium]